jgi:hypothetical protein
VPSGEYRPDDDVTPILPAPTLRDTFPSDAIRFACPHCGVVSLVLRPPIAHPPLTNAGPALEPLKRHEHPFPDPNDRRFDETKSTMKRTPPPK